MSKIKCVYANGDSFVFGQGLDPVGQTHFYDFTKKLRDDNWTGVIAKELGVNLDTDYYNDALPGGSNDRIVRTSIARLSELLEKYNPSEILVLIGWTESSRNEFYFSPDEGEKMYIPMLANCAPSDWTKLKVLKKMHDLYYGFFYNFNNSKIRMAQNVFTLQLFLHSMKIPFLFTNSLTVFINDSRAEHTSFFDKINDLPTFAKMIKNESYIDIPNCCQYLGDNNFKTLPCGHPSKDGHSAWARYVVNYLISKKII